MSTISCVSFRGHGSESTGSIAYRNKPEPCPNCGENVNFKGYSSYSNKKEPSTVGLIGGLVTLTAATIIGLGYAHKSNAFSKLKDGKVKDLLIKLEPASKKCHEWCSKAKNMFNSKKC